MESIFGSGSCPLQLAIRRIVALGAALSCLVAAPISSAQTMGVSPDPNPAVFTGLEGGPFVPTTSTVWIIDDVDDIGLDYTVSVDQPWLTVNAAAGSLVGAETDELEALLVDSEVAALGPGQYLATISVTNITNQVGNASRTVMLDISPSSFTVSPTFVNVTATAGGNDPAPAVVTLTSNGNTDLNYSLAWDAQDWLSINQAGGTVPAAGAAEFVVSFDVDALAPGTYVEQIDVTNTSNGLGNTTVVVTLVVTPTDPILTVSQLTTGGRIVVSPEGEQLSDGPIEQYRYQAGDVVTLTVELENGYELTTWAGDVPEESLTSNPIAITMSSSKSVGATVNGILWALNLSITGSGTGTILPAPVGSFVDNALVSKYPNGQVVTLQADADAGSIFLGWSGNIPTSAASANPIAVTMDRERTVTARFEQTVTINLSATAGGTAEIIPANGPYFIGQAVTILATPDTGFTFTGWSGAVTAPDNPLDLILDGPKTILANFAPAGGTGGNGGNGGNGGGNGDGGATEKVRLSISIEGDGIVTPASGDYDKGATVTLIATPNVGWVFAGWGGAIDGTDLVRVVTLNADTSVIARFEQDTSGDSGSVPPPLCGPVGLSFLPLSLLGLAAIGRRVRIQT